MSNIRLFYSKSLSLNLTDKLDKSQSHYVSKVMRLKEKEVFSLFNSSGEWEVKILNITKSIVEFNVNSAAEKCKNKIGDKWEGFANYWRTTQLEYTWLRSLMKRHKDFWQVTEDSLDKSMKSYKIDSSMKNELLDLYKILSTFKEVPEVLKSLKKKKF